MVNAAAVVGKLICFQTTIVNAISTTSSTVGSSVHQNSSFGASWIGMPTVLIASPGRRRNTHAK
jgi:2-methylcitrate dehydratase PrpD